MNKKVISEFLGVNKESSDFVKTSSENVDLNVLKKNIENALSKIVGTKIITKSISMDNKGRLQYDSNDISNKIGINFFPELRIINFGSGVVDEEKGTYWANLNYRWSGNGCDLCSIEFNTSGQITHVQKSSYIK